MNNVRFGLRNFFAVALVCVMATSSLLAFVPKTLAATDITVTSAKVISATAVLVTLNPGVSDTITAVDFSKWHIDFGGGGLTPIDPSSADITSAGNPWTITLNFAGGSFSNPATSFSASEGLYVDALGVTDSNGDTNAVVLHSASTEITDGQAPTTGIVGGSIHISADTGNSTDFTTKTAAQTISATLDHTLTADEHLWGTVDGGSTAVDLSTLGKVSGTTVSWTGATLLAGPNTIAFLVKDSASNQGPPSMQSYILDTTAPEITSVTSNATSAGWLKVGGTILFTAAITTPETGLTISPSTYNGGALSWSTSDAGATYTATYTVVEGQTDHPVTPLQLSGVTATDVADNVSSPVSGVDVAKTIDAHTPSSPVISLISGDDRINLAESNAVVGLSSGVVISGTNEAGSTVSVMGDPAVADSSTTWHYLISSTTIHGAGDGPQTVHAVAIDAAGNSPADGTRLITIDLTIPPNQDLVLSTPPGSVAGGSVVSITASSATVGGFSTDSVWFAPAGTTTFIAGSTMTTATGDATSMLAPTAVRSDYKLFVIDLAGNVSLPSTDTLTTTSSAPTFVSAKATSDTNIEVTFSKSIASVLHAIGSDFTSTGSHFIATHAAIDMGDATKVELTVHSLGSTAFTASDLAIATDAVNDAEVHGFIAVTGQTVADGQSPVFISSKATSDTNIEVTFSEALTVANAGNFTGTGFNVTAAIINADPTKVDLTVDSLGTTAFTSDGLNIAADAVEDVSAAHNANLTQNGLHVSDGQGPTFASVSVSPTSGHLAKIGDSVVVTGTADGAETGLTEVSPSTVNGVSSVFHEVGGGVYTITYTVVSGNTDISDSSALPVNIQLQDLAHNPSVLVSSISSGSAPGIDAHAPVISSLALTPSSGTKSIGDSIDMLITADAAGYSAGAITINGVATTGFVDHGDSTYTVTYTIVSGNTDRASGLVPASVVLIDTAGNHATAFTTVDTNTLVIDANKPVISSVTPLTGTSNNAARTVGYALNEAAADAAITFTRTSGTADTQGIHVFTLSGGQLTAAAHTVAISVLNADTGSFASGNALMNGAVYTITLDATDTAGNAADQVIVASVTYDTTNPVISLTSPADSSFVNSTFSSGYTLDGNVASGSITFARTGGSADALSHVYTFATGDKTSGAHTIARSVLEAGFGNALVDGTAYSITYAATDAAGNAATPVVNTAVTVVAPVSFSPVAGTFSATQNVTLTATDSTSIHYTIDGTDPTCSTGTVYTTAIAVTTTKTLKAISCYTGDVSSAVTSALYTINISSGGGGGGGGGGTVLPVIATVPITTPTPTPVTTPTPDVTVPSAAAPISVQNPANFDALIAALGVPSNPIDFAKYKPIVQADAAAFKVILTPEQDRAITNFVVYGVSTETVKLGTGERRALVRDYFETVGRPDISWEDMQRLTTGQKPVGRNLVKEQAAAGIALRDFTKMTGHTPDFKKSSEDIAWNTILYRIRFPRDLVLEQQGINEFKTIFKRTPSTPLDWSEVRALGYALR